MLEFILQRFDLSCLLILVIFFLFLGYRPPWWRRKLSDCRKSTQDIPGPLPIPVFGTRWVYSFLTKYHSNKLHEFYNDAFEKYGPIVKEEALWNVPVISIKDRQDIEKVVRCTGKYPIRPPTEAVAFYRKSRPDRYTSAGITNEQGIVWCNLRNALTGGLTSPKTIAEFLPDIEEIAEDWCGFLWSDRDKDGFVLDLVGPAQQLGLEAICALVLGRRMGFLLPEGVTETARNLADAVHRNFIACRDTYYGLPFWKLFPTPAYLRLVKSEEDIYKLALDLIENSDDSVRESAVFQSVLQAPVDNLEKTAAIVDFIAGGIHTLANSVVFLLQLIGSHPPIQARLFEDLSNNSTAYLKACINESFRVLPTAPLIARVTETDLDLSGYCVESGSVLLCHTGAACKDETNFASAGEFRPERWLGEEKAETSIVATHLVLPFGIGRRTCPGKRFVEQALLVVLTHVMKKFEISCDNSLGLKFEFIIAPESPVRMRFEERI